MTLATWLRRRPWPWSCSPPPPSHEPSTCYSHRAILRARSCGGSGERVGRAQVEEAVSASGNEFDLAVIGGGICGLAHALAGVRRGLRVVVIERDARANGASIRNFGFVTVTGQQRGQCWQRAMRSRQV